MTHLFFRHILIVNIIAPVISGCAIAVFTHWLSKRNQK
ncbi:type I toxin-antitoxin system Fst family toxin [Staphylococcus simulans]